MEMLGDLNKARDKQGLSYKWRNRHPTVCEFVRLP
jgi:hypothetical protein